MTTINDTSPAGLRTCVVLPDGFDRAAVNCHTDSWEAYDALDWPELRSGETVWKQIDLGGGCYLAAHQPTRARAEIVGSAA